MATAPDQALGENLNCSSHTTLPFREGGLVLRCETGSDSSSKKVTEVASGKP